MKHALALTALFSVVLAVSAAVAQTLEVSVPVALSAEVGLGLFVAAFTLLAFVSNYSAPRVTRDRRRAMVTSRRSKELFPYAG
jgi:uncharacterized membrane protein